MTDLVRRIPWPGRSMPENELLTLEWLVTNGLGGYASGTVAGVITRRYHGLLVAALPAPLGRYMMLNDVVQQIRFADARTIMIGGEERVGQQLTLHGIDYLAEFKLDLGLPVWKFEVGGFVIEKRIILPHGQNTVHVIYTLLAGQGPVRLELRPSIHFRPHEDPVSAPLDSAYMLTVTEDRYEVAAVNGPTLRFTLHGTNSGLSVERRKIEEIVYRIEESRGYAARGDLWSPGTLQADLVVGSSVTLIASTEEWETIYALTPGEVSGAEVERRRRLLAAAPPAAREGTPAELVLAADQFIIAPAGRVRDVARARAAGDEVRTNIAGYHWFTDWGRDTMISLEGLTLSTGRPVEAGWILRTFAYYIRDGLIPNMFPEGRREGLYHTADATLWFFHAIDRYLQATNDRDTLALLLPKLLDIIDHHVRGTRFGIQVDQQDCLLREGEQGYQLTWMDAKVDDWVVTPRRGKPVEINALWYNALKLAEGWLREDGREDAAKAMEARAACTKSSFNRKFWYEQGGYLYDVIDGEKGDDSALRPNQVFAISLRHPILDPSKWTRVVNVVREQLLTPLGLRSLARGHPDYKATYYGDLRARDAAYHQGTVWAWLIGPFIDAWLKVHPEDRAGARKMLEGFIPHLQQGCIGSISEIFDAEEPFTQRGCVAQAWSVAEVLRAWLRTET